MTDALSAMLDDLRRSRPDDEGAFLPWLEAISQVIAAYPTEIRRGAAAILVANDLCIATRIPLSECLKVVMKALERRGVLS